MVAVCVLSDCCYGDNLTQVWKDGRWRRYDNWYHSLGTGTWEYGSSDSEIREREWLIGERRWSFSVSAPPSSTHWLRGQDMGHPTGEAVLLGDMS